MSLKDPKNQKIMNDFIAEHAPLIHGHIKALRSAGKIPPHIEDEDLHMAGVHGLQEAIHNYDHKVAAQRAKEGDNPFEKYAATRIKGKMLDHAVAQNPVPKSLQVRAKNLAALANKPKDESES